MVPAGAKTATYGIAAVFLWITANLGIAFYVLVAAYLVDFGLNYDRKQEFIQKMTLYLGSTFFAYYLQNSDQFISIPLLHGLIVAVAAHEVIEVLAALKIKLDAYKQNHPSEAAQVDSLEALLVQAQPILTQFAALQAAATASGKSSNPPPEVTKEPQP